MNPSSSSSFSSPQPLFVNNSRPPSHSSTASKRETPSIIPLDYNYQVMAPSSLRPQTGRYPTHMMLPSRSSTRQSSNPEVDVDTEIEMEPAFNSLFGDPVPPPPPDDFLAGGFESPAFLRATSVELTSDEDQLLGASHQPARLFPQVPYTSLRGRRFSNISTPSPRNFEILPSAIPRLKPPDIQILPNSSGESSSGNQNSPNFRLLTPKEMLSAARGYEATQAEDVMELKETYTISDNRSLREYSEATTTRKSSSVAREEAPADMDLTTLSPPQKADMMPHQFSNESYSSGEWFRQASLEYPEFNKMPTLRPSSKNVMSIKRDEMPLSSPVAAMINDSNGSSSGAEERLMSSTQILPEPSVSLASLGVPDRPPSPSPSCLRSLEESPSLILSPREYIKQRRKSVFAPQVSGDSLEDEEEPLSLLGEAVDDEGSSPLPPLPPPPIPPQPQLISEDSLREPETPLLRERSPVILKDSITTGGDFRVEQSRLHKKTSFTILNEKPLPMSSQSQSPRYQRTRELSSPSLIPSRSATPSKSPMQRKSLSSTQLKLPQLMPTLAETPIEDSPRPSVQFDMSGRYSPSKLPTQKGILHQREPLTPHRPSPTKRRPSAQLNEPMDHKKPHMKSMEALPMITDPYRTSIPRLNRSALDLRPEKAVFPPGALPRPIKPNPNPTRKQKGLLKVLNHEEILSRIPSQSNWASMEDLTMETKGKPLLSPLHDPKARRRSSSTSPSRRSSTQTTSDRRSSNLSSVTTSDFSFRRPSLGGGAKPKASSTPQTPKRRKSTFQLPSPGSRRKSSSSSSVAITTTGATGRPLRTKIAKPTPLSPIIGTPNKDSSSAQSPTHAMRTPAAPPSDSMSDSNSRRDSLSKIPIRSQTNSRASSRLEMHESRTGSRAGSPMKEMYDDMPMAGSRSGSRASEHVGAQPGSRSGSRASQYGGAQGGSRSGSRASQYGGVQQHETIATSRSQSRAEGRCESRMDSRSQSRHEEGRSDSRTDSRSQSRHEERTQSRMESRVASRAEERAQSRMDSRTGSRAGSRSTSRAGSRVGSRAASRAESRAQSRSQSRAASRNESRAASRSTSRASTRPISLPGSRPQSRMDLAKEIANSRSNSRLSMHSVHRGGSTSPQGQRKSPSKSPVEGRRKSISVSPKRTTPRRSAARRSSVSPRRAKSKSRSRSRSKSRASPERSSRSRIPVSHKDERSQSRASGRRKPPIPSSDIRRTSSMKAKATTGKQQTSAKKTPSTVRKTEAGPRRTPSSVRRQGGGAAKKETTTTPGTARKPGLPHTKPAVPKREPSNLARKPAGVGPSTKKKEPSSLNLKKKAGDAKPGTSAATKPQTNGKKATAAAAGSSKSDTSSSAMGKPSKSDMASTFVVQKNGEPAGATATATAAVAAADVATLSALKRQPSSMSLMRVSSKISLLGKKRSDSNLSKKTLDLIVPETPGKANEKRATSPTKQLRDDTGSPVPAAAILEKSQKTLENIQKTVTEATEEIQKTISENLTDLKSFEQDMGLTSDSGASPTASITTVVEKKPSGAGKATGESVSRLGTAEDPSGKGGQKSPMPPSQPIEASVSVVNPADGSQMTPTQVGQGGGSADSSHHADISTASTAAAMTAAGTSERVSEPSAISVMPEVECESANLQSYNVIAGEPDAKVMSSAMDAEGGRKAVHGDDSAADDYETEVKRRSPDGQGGSHGGGSGKGSGSQEYLENKSLDNEDDSPRGCCRCCAKFCMPCRRSRCSRCCQRKRKAKHDEATQPVLSATSSATTTNLQLVDEKDAQKKPSCWQRLNCCKSCCGKKGKDKELVRKPTPAPPLRPMGPPKQSRCGLCLSKIFCCRSVNKIDPKTGDETEVKKCCFCIPCRRKRQPSAAGSMAGSTVAWQDPEAGITPTDAAVLEGQDVVEKQGCCKRFCNFLLCCRKKKVAVSDSRRQSIRAPPPEDTRRKLHVDLVEYTSKMKGAIPVLPLCLAWFCAICNILIPGLGTLLSGFFCLCVGIPRFSHYDSAKARLGSLIINIIVGMAQFFCVLFCFVGWGWSIWWGTIMLKCAKKLSKIRKVERLEMEEEKRQAAAAAATAAAAAAAAEAAKA